MASSLVDFDIDRASIMEKIDDRVEQIDVDNRTFERLYEEYTYLRQASRMDLAFAKAIDLVAVLEANARAAGTQPEPDLKAVATFNLASALHQLGHFSVAKPFYTESIMGLANAPKLPGLLQCCLQDIRQEQLEYMKLRMQEAAHGTIPPALTYLDGDGNERQWTEYEISVARKKAATIEHIMKAEASAPKKPKPRPLKPSGGDSEAGTAAGGAARVSGAAPMKLTLNTSAAQSNRDKVYPITSTPRAELW